MALGQGFVDTPGGGHYTFPRQTVQARPLRGWAQGARIVELSDNMKRMLRQLGEAINESLSHSAEINETIRQIKGEGYDLFLILEATIGLNPRAEIESGKTAESKPARRRGGRSGGDAPKPRAARKNRKVVFRISAEDRQFLRSLRIQVDERDHPPADKS